MAGFYNIYETNETATDNSVKYLFISSGDNDIIKAIEYRYVQDFNDSPLYNLGFGDYNIDDDEIDDQSNSNNGDVYPVFYTVLSTIPMFFVHKPEAVMMVQGSDNSNEYTEKCKPTCKKKCINNICRNLNRRIKAYRHYVNKNYEMLQKEYEFFGGLRIAGSRIITEKYEVGKEYDSIFCKKRISLCNED